MWSGRSEPRNHRRMHKRPYILPIVSLLCSLAIAELASRVYLRRFPTTLKLMFRYDAELGWRGRENAKGYGGMARKIYIDNNRAGFRDREHGEKSKPRVVFLGDSFVWGFDVNSEHRFTEQLRLREPDWDIFNLGVAGYGTTQELLLLKQEFERLHPDVIFLVFCSDNDRLDNSSDRRIEGYYRPYARESSDGVTIEGVPVPRTSALFFDPIPFLSKSALFTLGARVFYQGGSVIEVPDPTLMVLRAMADFAKSRHAKFFVGLTEGKSDPELLDWLTKEGIAHIDLDTRERFRNFGKHWNAAGHLYVSDAIHRFLLAQLATSN